MRTSTNLLATFLVLTAACGGDDSPPTTPGDTVTKLVGPEGATVELVGGAKVEIPEGALTETVSIKITELDDSDVAALPMNVEASGKPLAFEPFDVVFALPVKVTVPFVGDAAEVRPLKADDTRDTQWQTIVGADKTVDSKLEMNTTRFGVYFPVRPRRGSGVVTLPDGAVIEPGDAGLDAAIDAAIDDPKTATALIGPEGGSLQLLSGARVDVPAGALTQAIGIKITELEISDVAPLPANLEPAGKPFAFEPHGLMFAMPVKVTLPFTGDPVEVRPMKANDESDPAWQTILGATKTPDSKLELNTTAFSVYFAARPRRGSGVVTLPDGGIIGLDGSVTEPDAGGDASLTDAATTEQDGSITEPDAGSDAGVIAQEAYVKASNPGAADEFGYRVAISGDTMVVGARLEDSNTRGVNGDESNDGATWSGAVYVFVRSGSMWTQQAYLKASNADANDLFGYSVAIDGDTIVVGAQGEASNATGVNGDETSNSAANAGAAYVFVRSGSMWTQQAYLKASNTAASYIFGNSVAISGDTIAVGSNYEDSAATGINGDETSTGANTSGAVYVFVRSGSEWTQEAYVKASNTGASDDFGQHIALSGETLVVGARSEDSNSTTVNGDEADNMASNSGAAYVFVRSGTTWTQQAYLKASNAEASDGFGWSVGVSGDTVVVGAQQEDSSAVGVNGDASNNSAASSGAAYVFVRSGSTWTQQAYLKASNAGANDWFGWSVAVDGDQVVVGAPFEASNATSVNGDGTNNTAAEAGAAYLFVRNGNTWSEAGYIKTDNNQAGDRVGWSVAMSGDTAAISAQWEDSNATGANGDGSNNSVSGSGAVYIFR